MRLTILFLLILTALCPPASMARTVDDADRLLDQLCPGVEQPLLWSYLQDERADAWVGARLAERSNAQAGRLLDRWKAADRRAGLEAARQDAQRRVNEVAFALRSHSPQFRALLYKRQQERLKGVPSVLGRAWQPLLGMLLAGGEPAQAPEEAWEAVRSWAERLTVRIHPSPTPAGLHFVIDPFQPRPGSIRGRADGQPLPFLWGVSTAGAQWEGYDPNGIWATHEARGKVTEPIGKAAAGLELWENDLQLAAGMGLNAFRTSIEWSRIEPKPGVIDYEAVDFYHRLFRGIRRYGMEPVITLVHFSWPQWLEDECGGWATKKARAAFQRHVEFVSREYADEVDWWLTYNEPPVVIIAGYMLGINAPGYKDPLKAAAVSRAWIRCHKDAYSIIHRNDPVAWVSWNNYTGTYDIAGLFQIHKTLDTTGLAAGAVGETKQIRDMHDRLLDEWYNAAKAEGKKPGFVDYIGIDYYCRWQLPGSFKPAHLWEPHPEGLYDVLKEYHDWFKVPVLIAENGMATCNGEARPDGWSRSAFLVHHIKQVQRAVADGIPVIGYIHWSITDNWEWGAFDARFGLYSVDCRNNVYTRVPTPAVDTYRRIVEAYGVTPALEAAHPDPRSR